jgi:hypothetical protein
VEHPSKVDTPAMEEASACTLEQSRTTCKSVVFEGDDSERLRLLKNRNYG